MFLKTPIYQSHRKVFESIRNFDSKLLDFSELFDVEQVKVREEKLGEKLRFRINIRYRSRVEITPRTTGVYSLQELGAYNRRR